MTSAKLNIKVYCPTHKTDFEVQTVGRVVCASDPHLLAADFPYESFWEYCCDCQRFWPSDFKHGGQGAAACAACQRPLARRYLCEHCNVLSVESDDAGFRRKDYNIAAGCAVSPACPGCGRAAEGAAPRPHECRVGSTTFTTARASCPFCEEPLGAAAQRYDPERGNISFPASAEDCLKDAAGRESRVVRPDPLKGIIVKDPDGKGQFILVHNWDVPGGVLYLFPRITYFQATLDFYNQYEQFYECARPAAGSVWIAAPAVVKRVAGGWSLLRKGELEIKGVAPRASRAEQPRKKHDVRSAAPREKTRPEPSGARPATEAKTPPPAQTVTHTARVQTPPPQIQSPQTQSPRTEPLHTPMPSRPSTGAARAASLTYGVAAREAEQESRHQGGGRRALPIALGALVAVAGVGLLIATIASHSPNSNLGSNARTSPASNGDAHNSNTTASGSTEGASGTEVTNNYSPANPPPGMVYVSGGDFIMGSGADAYERPTHETSVEPFFIDTYEVTCGEYAKFTSATGYATPPPWGGKTCPAGWERLPVTGVNWYDAEAYAAWAGKRLPSEAEWEFAARGNDGRRYPWGDEWESAASNVNGKAGQLAEVGTYRSPSPFGAYDMSGNAWEWTATDFAAYPGGSLTKPPTGKVIRGGCYASSPSQATTTYRGVWRPREEKTYDQTGFRCVMDIPKRASQ